MTQSADDLKARDMVFCRFPEVDMVVGKAGRAETPTDPAPLDMIETMVNFRPREFWPKRQLRARRRRAAGHAPCWHALVQRRPGRARPTRRDALNATPWPPLPLFDAQMREFGLPAEPGIRARARRRAWSGVHGGVIGLLRENGSLCREGQRPGRDLPLSAPSTADRL